MRIHRHVRALNVACGLILLGLGAAYDIEIRRGHVSVLGFVPGLLVLGATLLPVGRLLQVQIVYLSGLFALAGAELAMELVMPPWARYKLDPIVLHAPIPGNVRTFHPDPACEHDPVPTRFNADGFRGGALQRDRPALRLIVYGDSYIEAARTPWECTFPKRLESELGKLQYDVEALNAGVNSYGPDQMFRRMEIEVDRFKPDAVVVAIYAGNDYGDLMRNKLFRLDEQGRATPNSYVFADHLQVTDRQRRSPRSYHLLRDAWRAVKHGLAEQPSPVRCVEEVDPQVQFEQYENYVVRGNNVVDRLVNDVRDTDIALEPATPSAQYKMKLLGAVFEQMRRLMSERGVPLLAVVVPDAIDLGARDHCGCRADYDQYPDYDPARLSGAAAKLARNAGIPAIDLFESFSQANSRDLYLPECIDNHWNARGQMLAAQLTAQRLVEMNWTSREGR